MRKYPKHKYVAHQFDFEDGPHYVHFYKPHWWSRWKIEMNGNAPAIYRKDRERLEYNVGRSQADGELLA